MKTKRFKKIMQQLKQGKNKKQAVTSKNIVKKKKQKKSPKPLSTTEINDYVEVMLNYTKSLEDQEHKKRLEVMEMELKILKEKLKSVILQREILELKKMRNRSYYKLMYQMLSGELIEKEKEFLKEIRNPKIVNKNYLFLMNVLDCDEIAAIN